MDVGSLEEGRWSGSCNGARSKLAFAAFCSSMDLKLC